jgi:hypothetical protein
MSSSDGDSTERFDMKYRVKPDENFRNFVPPVSSIIFDTK